MLRVTPIAWTTFQAPQHVPWVPDADNPDSRNGTGQNLAEFAGRACYQSWARPNFKTATNEGYIGHILQIGHESVLEHASVTFYLEGVSRSLTHELVRHRHLSFSQLSQRYVDESDAEMVMPDAINDPEWVMMKETFDEIVDSARDTYESLVSQLMEVAEARFRDWSKTERRKWARQAARSVLPNATETKIVVTGNYRAWRHFVKMRATVHADVEIRALAVAILHHLHSLNPSMVQDMVTRKLDDGTEIVEIFEAW